MSRLCLAVLVLLVASGCASTAPTSERDVLLGRWDMERIYDGAQDVSILQNPERDRYITLRADGSFESGGQPYGRNTGRWTYDPASDVLALDSDQGADNDSRWRVSLRGDVMEWVSAGVDAGRFRIVARRAG